MSILFCVLVLFCNCCWHQALHTAPPHTLCCPGKAVITFSHHQPPGARFIGKAEKRLGAWGLASICFLYEVNLDASRRFIWDWWSRCTTFPWVISPYSGKITGLWANMQTRSEEEVVTGSACLGGSVTAAVERIANITTGVHHPFLKQILKLPSIMCSEIRCFSPLLQ